MYLNARIRLSNVLLGHHCFSCKSSSFSYCLLPRNWSGRWCFFFRWICFFSKITLFFPIQIRWFIAMILILLARHLLKRKERGFVLCDNNLIVCLWHVSTEKESRDLLPHKDDDACLRETLKDETYKTSFKTVALCVSIFFHLAIFILFWM